MSKIYVSYTTRDDEFAQGLMAALRAQGHQITVEGTKLTAGINWRAELSEGLKAADVFIILISQSTMHSQYPMMELGTARAFAETSEKMLILPVVLGDLPLPTIVQDIQVIFARDRQPDELIPDIDQAISAFEGRRAAQEVEQKEISEVVQGNLAEFVDEAIRTQQQYEKRHKSSARLWYFIGYVSLVGGLLVTVYLSSRIIGSETTAPDYSRAISVSLLNIIAVAILAALARYAYSLGNDLPLNFHPAAIRVSTVSVTPFGAG